MSQKGHYNGKQERLFLYNDVILIINGHIINIY